ncbi:MAG TPA: GGDEF domain-containing protein, partial [Ruminococcus sp.]|nr:GGDEF domain-containing protein [Ruminococcus sp.]
TANSCGDNWKVICSVPTEIILKEKNEVQIYIVIVGIITTLIAVSLTILLSLKISNPVNNMVTVLDEKAHFDLLTGILNKRSYEEYVENVMKNAGKSEKYALILLDVDNFKGVNDTLGHEYGDKVLANIGDILRSLFRKEDFKGRIGGDEFSVFLNLASVSDDEYIGFTKKKCEQLCKAFHNNYTGDDGNYKISASIGVAFYNVNGNTFSELYKYADKALYNSKHKGKDTYTIYTEELES